MVGRMVFPDRAHGPSIWHDNGMIMRFRSCQTTKLSRTLWNVNAAAAAPVYGFPWQAGQNASTNYSGNGNDYNGDPSYFTFKVLAPMGYDSVPRHRRLQNSATSNGSTLAGCRSLALM